MPDDQQKTKITHPTRVITLANLLSILRAFLALPIVYSLARDRIVVAVSLAVSYTHLTLPTNREV